MKVLIADDSAFVRLCLRNIIVEGGHEVVGEAGNGREAFDLYMEKEPDIVTMDITMPEVDGIEAIKMIKAKDPGAIILVVSAMGQEPIIREALTSGARGFITKPFVPERVLQEINTAARIKNRGV